MGNILRGLFGKRDASLQRDVSALAAGLSVPAVQVVRSNVATLSHFGGSPNLPAECRWPEKEGERLAFLARLSLAELQQAQGIDWLPSAGALLFFYDMEGQPWGFDPKDRGGAAVLHVPDLASPSETSESGASEFDHHSVAFRRIEVFPSGEREPVEALGFSNIELDRYAELADGSFEEKPKHQIAGYPSPVQGDSMELECQLVTNGLYCGDPAGYQDPRAAALESGVSDWRLLFQIDTDDDIGMMWGDVGMIYYWVRKEAAAQGKFDEAWLILQCH